MKVQEDMQRTTNYTSNPWKDTSLIAGELGFCTQALLNLVMNGEAVFEVYSSELLMMDDLKEDEEKKEKEKGERQDMEIDKEDEKNKKGEESKEEGKEKKKKQDKKVPVGFLSREETEEVYVGEVGEVLKCPMYPVWVFGGSGHYTILFATDPYCIHGWDEASQKGMYGCLFSRNTCFKIFPHSQRRRGKGKRKGVEDATQTLRSLSLQWTPTRRTSHCANDDILSRK